MPGYRLTFGTMDMRVNTMAEALVSADQTMGEVTSTIAERGEMISQDYLSTVSSNQFIIRFAAPDDAMASAIANAALREVSAPLDNAKIERRSRSYVPVSA